MSLDIVTYCSENYKDSLEFCLPWWVKYSECKRIIIYTDGFRGEPPVDARIPILYRPEFSKCTDWLTNIGRQPQAVRHYVTSVGYGERFVFIGTDCITIRTLIPWFEKLNTKKCIGGIRVGSQRGKMPVNHFLGVTSQVMDDFTGRWCLLADSLWRGGVGMVAGRAAYDQISYGLLMNFCADFVDNIIPLDDSKLLSENDNIQQWAYDIAWLTNRRQPIFMLHFKGGRWKDKELVREILDLTEVKHDEGRVCGSG